MNNYEKKLKKLLTENLEEALKSLKPKLGVITAWNPMLISGRSVVFLDDDGLDYERLANINLALFGRGTTLNERLLYFSAKVGSKTVRIEISINDEEIIAFNIVGCVVRIVLNRTMWEMLRIEDEGDFLELRKQMISKDFPAAEAGRTLHELYGSSLRRQRLMVLNKWLYIFTDNDIKLKFFKMLWYLTSEEDIRFNREAQGFDEKKEISFNDLSLSVDFTLVDQFLTFLQAIYYYCPDAKYIVGISKAGQSSAEAFSKLPDEGASINIILTDHSKWPDDIWKNFDTILDQSNNKTSQLLDTSKPPKINLGNIGKFAQALKHASDDIKPFFQGRIKDFPGFYNLMNAMDLLSNAIHEGRNLCFTFLYGEGDLWRVTQNVLSEEEPEMYAKLPKAREFAHLMEHHWSIFQGERVAGFIDKTQANKIQVKGGIPLSKIIQLKPFSTVYSKLLKKALGILDDAIAVSTSGRGRVRIYFSPLETSNADIIMWDTINNELGLLSKNIGSIADTILKLSISGDFQYLDRIKMVIEETIEEVSDSLDEGTMIIVGQEEPIKKYLQDMDMDGTKMNWRVGKPLILLDKILFRALLIMDGATWFKSSDLITSSVVPRFVVYPYCCSFCPEQHAFSALDKKCKAYNKILPGMRKTIESNEKVLNGKGSKHHGAANLSLLLYILNGCKPDKFRIFTISADGPIKEWPHELIERRQV